MSPRAPATWKSQPTYRGTCSVTPIANSNAGQEEADAIQQNDDATPNDSMPEAFMPTDKVKLSTGALHESLDSDIVDGVALAEAGLLLWCVVTTIMHSPDQLVNRSGNLRPDADLAVRHIFLVVVIDRNACEDGWVLIFALNQKGDILPFRARNKAYYIDVTLTG
ncbi:hypothetical protein BJX62DRAFT_245036 [Aspergillus germanicus]